MTDAREIAERAQAIADGCRHHANAEPLGLPGACERCIAAALADAERLRSAYQERAEAAEAEVARLRECLSAQALHRIYNDLEDEQARRYHGERAYEAWDELAPADRERWERFATALRGAGEGPA